MKRSVHLSLLGILYIGLSLLSLLGALVVLLTVGGAGLLSGDLGVFFVTSGIGIAIAIFLLVLGLPGLIGGFGLLQRRPWARTLVLILGILNLINFPFGTAVGIYTLYVLFRADVEREFGRARI